MSMTINLFSQLELHVLVKVKYMHKVRVNQGQDTKEVILIAKTFYPLMFRVYPYCPDWNTQAWLIIYKLVLLYRICR